VQERDITEQFRCARKATDMVNDGAATQWVTRAPETARNDSGFPSAQEPAAHQLSLLHEAEIDRRAAAAARRSATEAFSTGAASADVDDCLALRGVAPLTQPLSGMLDVFVRHRSGWSAVEINQRLPATC
jgi:hypothetical protein